MERPDQRTSTRIRFETTAILQIDDQNIAAHTSSRDISLDGIFLRTAETMPINAPCLVIITISRGLQHPHPEDQGADHQEGPGRRRHPFHRGRSRQFCVPEEHRPQQPGPGFSALRLRPLSLLKPLAIEDVDPPADHLDQALLAHLGKYPREGLGDGAQQAG